MVSTGSAPAFGATAPDAWRTRDIVVTAVIGVAFGVVFWFWNTIWAPLDGVFALAPWAKDLLYAVWLIPAVLAPLVVKKRGAALFAEITAAGVSALLGSQWGPDVLLSGFVQGAAAFHGYGWFAREEIAALDVFADDLVVTHWPPDVEAPHWFRRDLPA